MKIDKIIRRSKYWYLGIMLSDLSVTFILISIFFNITYFVFPILLIIPTAILVGLCCDYIAGKALYQELRFFGNVYRFQYKGLGPTAIIWSDEVEIKWLLGGKNPSFILICLKNTWLPRFTTRRRLFRNEATIKFLDKGFVGIPYQRYMDDVLNYLRSLSFELQRIESHGISVEIQISPPCCEGEELVQYIDLLRGFFSPYNAFAVQKAAEKEQVYEVEPIY